MAPVFSVQNLMEIIELSTFPKKISAKTSGGLGNPGNMICRSLNKILRTIARNFGNQWTFLLLRLLRKAVIRRNGPRAAIYCSIVHKRDMFFLITLLFVVDGKSFTGSNRRGHSFMVTESNRISIV